MDVEEFTWLQGGKEFLWLSERDGWRHAYAVSRDGGGVRLLTPGDYDVAERQRRGREGRLALRHGVAGRRDQAVRLPGGARRQGQAGAASARPGQTGVHRLRRVAVRRSGRSTATRRSTRRPSPSWCGCPAGEPVRTLAGNAALEAKVEGLARKRVEFFRLPIGGGVEVDGWRILPPGLRPGEEVPAARPRLRRTGRPDRAGQLGRQHLPLAPDARPAGLHRRELRQPRDARAARPRLAEGIYRQIGILASADQAAATRAALAAWPFVDRDRVGVWGWSGGGSMTLNAMFRYPDLYKTGISVASVPVQRLYDSIYQERYMGLPKDNEEGFRNGSPITFAKQLQGNLLIVHGTGDDNVHYQGFEMLVNELVAAGRRFDMMSYPNRSHGISEGAGTTLHLYTLFTRYLNEKLPVDSRQSEQAAR